MTDSGEVLLDGRHGSLAAELLNVGGDMQGSHAGDGRNARFFAPKQELTRRLAIGPARVFVADLRGELSATFLSDPSLFLSETCPTRIDRSKGFPYERSPNDEKKPNKSDLRLRQLFALSDMNGR
jgi:hypothetical protein